MALLNKYMSPAGERMLWTLAFMAAGLCAFLLRRVWLRRKNSPLRIRTRMWYSGGLKMSVNIRNIRNTMAEMEALVIVFRQPRMGKRKFRITAPGAGDIFPLGLSPQTAYDFTVEFTKLYERDPVLRKYRRVSIDVKDKCGKTIVEKKIKIRNIF